ncbi:MAG: hypothetical protein J6J27_00235 [Alphaproteobacteria bacterium]|nr:hypothetical protein [Alphaproteobacteria bacterium]
MRNIEFAIAIGKLDLLDSKIAFTEDRLSEKEDYLLSMNFIAIQFLKLLDEFFLDPIIFNEIIKFSENFYNKNKKQYYINSLDYIQLEQSNIRYKKRFNKIADQLEFLDTKQR